MPQVGGSRGQGAGGRGELKVLIFRWAICQLLLLNRCSRGEDQKGKRGRFGMSDDLILKKQTTIPLPTRTHYEYD